MSKKGICKMMAIMMGVGMLMQPITTMAADVRPEFPIEIVEPNPMLKFLKGMEKLDRGKVLPEYRNPKGIAVPKDPTFKVR